MGSDEERKAFVGQVRKACAIGKKLKDLGIRKYGVIRIDSAAGPGDWAADPAGNTKKIAATFREAADVAESYGERLAAEGEICWGGMHSWKYIAELMEETGRPQTVGIQADMAHLSLYTLGYNAPEHRILPENYDWQDISVFEDAIRTMAHTLRPWIKDFHVAQNDATVKGQGSHDKTGRHCLPNDPNGKINVTKVAGIWLRDDNGELTKSTQHICWDGCRHVPPMTPWREGSTWNDVLSTVIYHGAKRARLGLNRINQDMPKQKSKHRIGRLRLHGTRPRQRLSAGPRLLRPPVHSRPESRLCKKSRTSQSLRR